MIDMLDIFMSNLSNVGIAVGLFIISYVANICFSIYYNTKILQQNFDKQKIINSILKLIAMSLGLIALTTVITFLPNYLTLMGLEIPQDFTESFGIITIITLFVSGIYKYIKEAFTTFQNILNPSEEKTPSEDDLTDI